MKSRFYSSSVGRFLQPDSIGYAGGLNLYTYVQNAPLDFKDPLGMFGEPHGYIPGLGYNLPYPIWGPGGGISGEAQSASKSGLGGFGGGGSIPIDALPSGLEGLKYYISGVQLLAGKPPEALPKHPKIVALGLYRQTGFYAEWAFHMSIFINEGSDKWVELTAGPGNNNLPPILSWLSYTPVNGLKVWKNDPYDPAKSGVPNPRIVITQEMTQDQVGQLIGRLYRSFDYYQDFFNSSWVRYDPTGSIVGANSNTVTSLILKGAGVDVAKWVGLQVLPGTKIGPGEKDVWIYVPGAVT